MATIQRNIKTYGNRNFVAEVASAPSNYAPILSNELDADLDTVYAAWNGGTDTVNLKDGSVTFAKLAPDAQLWRDTGTTLTPGTNFTSRSITAAPIGDAFRWGTGTILNRLIGAATGCQWRINAASSNATDDPTKSAWAAALDVGADAFFIYRAPPAATAAFAQLLKLDAGGVLTLAGGAVFFPAATGTIQFVSAGAPIIELFANLPTQPGYVAAKPCWFIRCDTNIDHFEVWRQAPNTGAQSVPMTVLANGTVQAGLSFHATGASAGLRCQGIGSVAGDGYSNAFGVGWDGTKIQVRVDATALGSMNITPPSDGRLKINVTEDIPGLAAVCALRPISFEYDQTKREIGFPTGRLYGLIAQEAQAHVPAVIDDDGSEDHWLGLDYRLLVPVLIRAIQELAQKVEAGT